MRSKVTVLYQPMVIIDSFDLISRNWRCASFPSRGSLSSEWSSLYFLGQHTPPGTGKPVPAPSYEGAKGLCKPSAPASLPKSLKNPNISLAIPPIFPYT